MNEFDLKNGQVRPGFVAMLASAAAFLLLPFLLITAVPSLTDGAEALLPLANFVLVLGLPVAFAAFFRGFYDKGTRSRLSAGGAESSLAVLYCIVVFLSEPFVQALPHGLVADSLPMQLIALGALWQCLRMTRHLDHYLSNRIDWLKAQGIEAGNAPRPAQAGLGEFRMDRGDSHAASETAIWSTRLLSILPSLISLAIWLALGVAISGEPASFDALLASLCSVAWSTILFGYPLALLAWLIGFHAKGTVSRLTFALALALVLALYMYAVVMLSSLESGLDGAALHTEMEMVLLMALLMVAMVALGHVGTFVDNRKQWKRDVGLPYEERPLDPEHAMMEVHPRTGSLEKGAAGARSALLRFMVIPVIVLVLAVPFLARSGEGAAVSIAEILALEVQTIIVWAVPLVVLGFVRGFYPLGGLGRMCFGIAMSLFIALYLFALLLGGALEAWVEGQVPLDLDQVWLFLMVPVAFHGLMQVAEMLDHRREWKVAIGRRVPEAIIEEERHPLLLDFRLRYGRYVGGTKEASRAGRRYLCSPAITVLVIGAVLQKLTASTGIEQLSALSGSLGIIFNALLLFALPLMVLAFFRGFYPKGSFSRLAFGCGVAATLALWVWALSQGGRVATDLGMEEVNIGISLDVSGLIMLFAIVELLWCLYYLAEFLSYRKDWIANGFLPVDESAPKKDAGKMTIAVPDQAGQ